MKLYGLGDIDDWGCFAIVMAENEKEAWDKTLTQLSKEDKFLNKEFNEWKSNNSIKELHSGVWFGENA